MVRIATIIIAFALIAIGAVLLPLPIPLGVPLLAFGLILLLGVSRIAVIIVRRVRRRSNPVHNTLNWIEARAPTGFSKIIRKTKPRRMMLHPRAPKSA